MSSRSLRAAQVLLFATGLVAACSGGVNPGTTSASASSSSASASSTTSGDGGAGTVTATATGTGTSTATATGVGGGSSTATGVGGAGVGGAGVGGAGGKGGAGGGFLDVDQDGDGWTVNEGDCCDTGGNCADPVMVNPGAFELPGNNVDDDCDPSTLDGAPVPTCGPGPLVTPTSGLDLLQAMDLCQVTTENPPKPLRKWGVISAELLRADGNNAPGDLQVGVLGGYGATVVPERGPTMAAISSGTARDAGDPGWIAPQNPGQPGGGYVPGTIDTIPAVFLAAHNGVVPSPASCPPCNGAFQCVHAYDSADLKARIRVPTNANSFHFDLRFFSSEYPDRLCTQKNDFFVALLTSSWVPDPAAMPPQLPLPADRNIAFDAQKNPLSVDNAFFDLCFPPMGSPPGTCPSGTLDLVGTGMGGAGNGNKGAGTTWLIEDAPVVPGETIEIDFMIWDSGDGFGDSLALLDKFQWSFVQPSSADHP